MANTQQNRPGLTAWLEPARPRTIPLSVAGAVIAAGLSVYYGVFSWSICILMIITAALLQVLSNFANDYGDYSKGTDNEDRIGPARSLQKGTITQEQMKRAVIMVAGLAFFSGAVLLLVSFELSQMPMILVFLVLGLAAIAAAIKYTVGRGAYGYHALGDIFAFLFFGPVAVIGGFYLYGHSFYWPILLPACGVGLLTAGVLNVNNMRDIENDERSGKNTLVVRIGLRNAQYYHAALVIFGIAEFLVFSLVTQGSVVSYAYMIAAIPLVLHVRTILRLRPEDAAVFDNQLRPLSMMTLALSILFSIFINL